MAYTKKTWKDYPDTSTPITANDLNNIENGIAGVLDWIYPVGTIYETTSTNLDTTTKMANHFGGTWEVYGAGRVLVAKSADTEFDTIGETGGSKYLQKHKHTEIDWLADTDYPISLNTGSTGGYAINNWTNGIGVGRIGTNEEGTGESGNLQPYIVVYRYRRTA